MFTRNINFKLEDWQYDNILKWYEDIVERKRNGNYYFGAIGGEVTVSFTPTGVGMGVVVKCCGEELDVSNI